MRLFAAAYPPRAAREHLARAMADVRAMTGTALRWGDPEPIAALVFACMGLMATFFVTAIFIRYLPPRLPLCSCVTTGYHV